MLVLNFNKENSFQFFERKVIDDLRISFLSQRISKTRDMSSFLPFFFFGYEKD